MVGALQGTPDANKWLTGSVEGELLGFRAGGTAPGLGGSMFNVTGNQTSGGFTVTYAEPGFIGSSGLVWYLYAMFPRGLPRWAQYLPSQLAGGAPRLPVGFRGIPVASNTPVLLNGGPSAVLHPPFGMDVLGTTPSATLIGASTVSGGAANGYSAQGGLFYPATSINTLPADSGTLTTLFAKWLFGDALQCYPASARSVVLQFQIAFTMTGGSDNIKFTTKAYDANNAAYFQDVRIMRFDSDASVVYEWFEVEVPLVPASALVPDLLTPRKITLEFASQLNPGSGLPAAPSAQVLMTKFRL